MRISRICLLYTSILQKSPSAIKAFEAYQIAVGAQHGAVTEQAFESGLQTAFQMLLAGLPLPEGTHDYEFPLTLQELRKMNGQRVFCLETNEDCLLYTSDENLE